MTTDCVLQTQTQKSRTDLKSATWKSRQQTENKAVYTAALVAVGWAGVENLKKWFVTDGQTDRRTDGPKSGLYSRVSATKNWNWTQKYNRRLKTEDCRRMSRNVKWAGVELAILLMIQIQQNYISLYSWWSNIQKCIEEFC